MDGLTRREFLGSLGALLGSATLPACDIAVPPLSRGNTEEVQELLSKTHQSLTIIDDQNSEEQRESSLNALNATINGTTYFVRTIVKSTRSDERVLTVYARSNVLDDSYSARSQWNHSPTYGVGYISSFQTETGYTAYSYIEEAIVQLAEASLVIYPTTNQRRDQLHKAYEIPLSGYYPSYFFIERTRDSAWDVNIVKFSKNVQFTPTDSLGAWPSDNYHEIQATLNKY